MTSRRRAGSCSKRGRKKSSTSWESNPMDKGASYNWCSWKREATIKTKKHSENILSST